MGNSPLRTTEGSIKVPAAFIPIPFCIAVRINAHFEAYPNVMNHVIHFRSENTDPSESECADVATMVSGWLAANYAVNISSDWTLDSVEAWSANSQTGAYALVSEPCPGQQSATTQPDAAPLVLLKTGTRGRSYTGRFYALAPDSNSIGQTQYTSTVLNGHIAAFEGLIALANTAGYPLVVASPTHALITNVTAITASQRLTKQTRRRLGFGG